AARCARTGAARARDAQREGNPRGHGFTARAGARERTGGRRRIVMPIRSDIASDARIVSVEIRNVEQAASAMKAAACDELDGAVIALDERVHGSNDGLCIRLQVRWS